MHNTITTNVSQVTSNLKSLPPYRKRMLSQSLLLCLICSASIHTVLAKDKKTDSPTKGPTGVPSPVLTPSPTVTGTAHPSTTPSLATTTEPPVTPETSAPSPSPTSGPFVVVYPFFRYTKYSELSDESKAAATVLGYNNNANKDWDLPNTNPIEKSAFFYLTDNQKEATKTLGFPTEPYVGLDLINYEGSETWDCYVNHYGDYDWAELVKYGLAQYWEALGYNSKHWEENSTEAPPPAADKFWDEFTEDEQEAADSLCYFEQTWNEELTIDLWPDDLQGPAPPTAPPSNSPTAAPTPLPTMTPTNVDGSTNPPEPTSFPTMAPTTPATATPTTATPTTATPTTATLTTATPTTATPTEAADVTPSSPTGTTSGAFALASSTNLHVLSVFAVVVMRMLLV